MIFMMEALEGIPMEMFWAMVHTIRSIAARLCMIEEGGRSYHQTRMQNCKKEIQYRLCWKEIVQFVESTDLAKKAERIENKRLDVIKGLEERR